jgi:hypothetical protein
VNEPSLNQKLSILLEKWVMDLVENDKDIVRAAKRGNQDEVIKLEGFGIALDRCSDELAELVMGNND